MDKVSVALRMGALCLVNTASREAIKLESQVALKIFLWNASLRG